MKQLFKNYKNNLLRTFSHGIYLGIGLWIGTHELLSTLFVVSIVILAIPIGEMIGYELAQKIEKLKKNNL